MSRLVVTEGRAAAGLQSRPVPVRGPLAPRRPRRGRVLPCRADGKGRCEVILQALHQLLTGVPKLQVSVDTSSGVSAVVDRPVRTYIAWVRVVNDALP
ncbi:hypothetical protein GCM10010448_66090 [Streptomyces glomeratus]|uniref:Uncharacterized protein n=2 Tax=Streptomyces glomeratus TaxID=284452 RepID=A0ABP6M526_9ACTN